MAIFRNNEDNLPPLIPTVQPAGRSFESAGVPPLVPVAKLPLIPELPPIPSMPVPPALPEQQLPQLSPDQAPVPPQAQPTSPEPQPVVPEQQPAPLEPIARVPEQPEQKEDDQGAFLRRKRALQDDTQQQGAAQSLAGQAKTPERAEIEKLLSAGLTELYQTMTPEQQEQFRLRGEETATAIEQMVTSFKATTRKVLSLIRNWLQAIPGVNKYFLEQETKLKTDEILKYQRKLKKQRSSRITL